MRTTTVFEKNLLAYKSGVRRIVNKGGTSAGKTFAILQLLILIARKHNGTSISVVSETLPHLKLGAIKDFEAILKEDGLYSEANHNMTDRKYTFGDSYIEFFSADSSEKVTGPRRDILYLNEVINLTYETVRQMELRTKEVIFYDFNPNFDFFITDKILSLPSNEYVLIKSNYKDNEWLAPAIAHEIELNAARDPNFKRVHIDVEFGMSEGLIFTNWTLCDAMPVTDKSAYGMDFGFTNDPSTIVNLRLQDGELWLNELLYQTGLTNNDIASFIKEEELNDTVIIADSAEPKSIEELNRAGVKVKAAAKGADSVRAGIDWMKRYRINITKRSLNAIREFRNYKWKVDNNGAVMNEPVGIWNHCIDPTRYASEVFRKPEFKPAKFNY